MDFGQFYIKWKKPDKAFSHFEQAYQTFFHFFEENTFQTDEFSINFLYNKREMLADAAYQLASILEE